MNNASVLVILVCFMTLFHSGAAIKCWICSSRTDPKCNDPFVNESIPLNDCNNDPHKPSTPSLIGAKATMCRKVRQKVDNEWRVTRSCAYLGEPGEGTGNENVCHYLTESYNVFRETCTCNSKDGCNHGFLSHGNLLTIWIMFAISLFF
ncbi:uncharacterized protein LOC107372187 [Tetranychus urticae]|uniref:uncharacterized protein LOC107372187 n=1 Tax=Tetranychus urticae TaxID=32264 RepID=UPI00077BC299|nr:uncharacterized protein LOC107372187 [Tetranychus urticae]